MILPPDVTLYDAGNILKLRNDTESLTKLTVFSGSYNPLHEGHLAMVKYVEEAGGFKGFPVVFELSRLNCDKGILDETEVLRRVAVFERICRPIFVTHRPNFVEKSFLFTHSWLAIGDDTLERINEVKYAYTEYERDRCFDLINNNGCRFLVFPRKYKTAEEAITKVCPKLELIARPTVGFKPVEISSTAIRNRR